MTSERARRLAAVWFADMVGYSTLSSRDENAALELVQALQSISREEVESNGGRVVKFSGDATLAMFETVDGALRAALGVQKRFQAAPTAQANETLLRIGLHLGEITEADDGDVYGDGVNVAARLQGKAPPGAVLVSRAARETVRGRADLAVQWATAWHHLKGLGFARTYVAAPTDAPPPPSRRLPTRAIAVGLTTALVAFGVLMLSVAMRSGEGASDGGDEGGWQDLVLDEETVQDGVKRLNLGIEEYAAGSWQKAVTALAPFTKPPLRAHPQAAEALRYLARAHLRGGNPELARATLAQMVNAEPPLALLIPGADVDSLLDLYYDVRRDAALDQKVEPPAQPVSGLVVFDFETAGDSPPELGPSVAQMVASDLEGFGFASHYFWPSALGIRGERAYAEFGDEVGPDGGMAATHALLGRVSVADGDVVISARVYDLRGGTLAASVLVNGAWPDLLLDVVQQLGEELAADLGPADGGR